MSVSLFDKVFKRANESRVGPLLKRRPSLPIPGLFTIIEFDDVLQSKQL